MGLRTRIILLTGVMLIIATLLFGIVTYREQEEALLSGIDARLEATARLAKEILPEDYHDKIAGVDSVSEAGYLRIVDRWNRLCTELGMEYIWSLMLIDGKTVFTSASSTSKDIRRGDHAKFFETHSNPELYTAAFATLKPQYQINDDKWGRIKVVLLPFKDARGRPFLFGASMKTTAVDALLRKTIWQSLEISAGILFLGVFLSVLFSTSLVRPLEKLSDLANSITKGNWGQVVEPSGAIEIRSLARCVNEMSRSIQEKISERKQAEEDKRQTEERYGTLFSRANDGIFILTAGGKLIEVNASFARMHGYSTQEMRNMNLTDLDTPDTSQRVAERMQRLFAGEALTFEVEHYHRDGHVFPLEVSASVIPYGDESFIQCFHRDITDRKRAEEEKRILEERLNRGQKMEALGQLAGGVAHDLNNVLGILTGYSELLLNDIPEGSRSRGYVDKILQSTEKGAAIIQDLLTMARRGVTVSDTINLNGLVAEFIQTPVFEKIKDHHPHVTFRTECDQNLMNLKGSPVHLEKTLMNLVSNAAEAIAGEGEVTIRTQSCYLDQPLQGYDEVNEGDYAVLCVSDTGAGITAEHRERIFEPFFTKKTMGRSGTGLGLAIVWGTVKDHSGYIDVQTEVGKGTTFTLYFPVTREELTAQQPTEPIERYMGNGESVLVVDDIAEQREIASLLLTTLGYQVNLVAGGEEAVQYLKGNKADILVLDMIMKPGMDGLDTYQRVLEINPQQKAIIVSGFSETERVREALKLGAGIYLKKPYVMEKIGVAMRDVLNQKPVAPVACEQTS